MSHAPTESAAREPSFSAAEPAAESTAKSTAESRAVSADYTPSSHVGVRRSSGYTAKIDQHDGAIIASFGGEISTPHYSEFRNDYNNLCRQILAVDAPRVVLDLSQTTFFGSLFVGIMLKLSMRVRASGGGLIICGLSEQLSLLLQKLLLLEKQFGEGHALQHAPTLEAALAIIRQKPKPGTAKPLTCHH